MTVEATSGQVTSPWYVCQPVHPGQVVGGQAMMHQVPVGNVGGVATQVQVGYQGMEQGGTKGDTFLNGGWTLPFWL